MKAIQSSHHTIISSIDHWGYAWKLPHTERFAPSQWSIHIFYIFNLAYPVSISIILVPAPYVAATLVLRLCILRTYVTATLVLRHR